MAEWQYARVIVRYEGVRTEVRRRGWLGTEESSVYDWSVTHFGPGDEPYGQYQQTGSDLVLVDVLNTWGQAGWEVITAFHSENRFEYLLKRADDGVVTGW